MMNNGMTPADIAAVMRDGDWGNGGGLIWLIVILAVFGGGFGWGNRGYCGESPATQSGVDRAVDQQTLISKIDGITYGIADATYALNNSIVNGFSQGEIGRNNMKSDILTQMNNNVMQNMRDTFALQKAIGDASVQQSASDNLTRNIIERNFADTNYNMANNTCQIKQAIDGAKDAILGYLTNDKIASLQAENQTLRFNQSQIAQNAYLVDKLNPRPTPVPAYIVQNPYCNCSCNNNMFGYYGTAVVG